MFFTENFGLELFLIGILFWPGIFGIVFLYGYVSFAFDKRFSKTGVVVCGCCLKTIGALVDGKKYCLDSEIMDRKTGYMIFSRNLFDPQAKQILLSEEDRESIFQRILAELDRKKIRYTLVEEARKP